MDSKHYKKMISRHNNLLAVLLAFLLWGAGAKAQENKQDETSLPQAGIKTNLLYDATATLNLGVEFRTGNKTSLDVSGNWNPFTFAGNRKWKHFLIQPEFRLWTEEAFSGHFFGFHAHYAYYNVSRLPAPPFSTYMGNHRFEGWLAGAGASWGHRWDFTRNWAMEATVGVGYAYLDYGKYPCGKCGEKIGDGTKNYFGPTKAGITLIYSFGGKKKPASPEPPAYVPPDVVEEKEALPAYEPQFAVSYATPEVEAVKQRSEGGKAYLEFAAGRSQIVPSFKDNAAELKKIYDLIEAVKGNPDARITGIMVTGHASPEGPEQSNLSLSEKRANALKDQIKALYGFPENIFTVSGKGEDWAMLDTLVYRSTMANKYAILEITRGTDRPDARERKLEGLEGGAPYREMKALLFPQLRRSDYELHYTVLPFTVEKGKEVFSTNPSNLSLNEMFLIAKTYEPGSGAFTEVFETAARVFPGDDTANLNAAASALSRKEAVSAARYLEKVAARTAAYWNNAGVLAFMQGDSGKAAACFARSISGGSGEASRNKSELDKHMHSLQGGR